MLTELGQLLCGSLNLADFRRDRRRPIVTVIPCVGRRPHEGGVMASAHFVAVVHDHHPQVQSAPFPRGSTVSNDTGAAFFLWRNGRRLTTSQRFSWICSTRGHRTT